MGKRRAPLYEGKTTRPLSPDVRACATAALRVSMEIGRAMPAARIAAITGAASLEVTVLDILNNGKDLAVVDSSVEAHMLDLLIYRETAKLPQEGNHTYEIAGKTCLAGDIFGDASFAKPLEIGDRVSIQDAAGYTMVKKNWFNGVKMPSIAIKVSTS